jgi:16S rRNA pseudouridine516 synthase
LRLDRLLANTGVGSRSEVKVLLNRGHCTVNGFVIRDPAMKIDDPSTVLFCDRPLDRPHGVLVVLNKPVGFACSHESKEAPLVDELLPPSWAIRTPRPEWVGRLDRDTSGLLVITDDHQLLHRLTSPKQHVMKRYDAVLCAPLPSVDEAIERFASGALVLEGESTACRAATLSVDVSDPCRVTIELTEGRYHQVRRMVAACGGHVEALHRSRFGCFEHTGTGEEIPPGEYRDVTLADLLG